MEKVETKVQFSNNPTTPFRSNSTTNVTINDVPMYIDNNSLVKNRLKSGRYDVIDISEICPVLSPSTICSLKNGYLLIADNEGLCLFDKTFTLVRRIWTINNELFFARALATNTKGEIFILDNHNNRVVKTDFEFTKFNVFGGKEGSENDELNCPLGFCYHKSHLYICDHLNKRIQKISSTSLEFRTTFLVGYKPEKIEIIDEGVCVRSWDDIYFYSLPAFTKLFQYSRKAAGIIGKLNTMFYEYCDEKINCFNRFGELDEAIESGNFQGILEPLNSTEGKIISYSGRVLICYWNKQKLIII